MDANEVAKLLSELALFYDPWDNCDHFCPNDIVDRSKIEELADACLKHGAKPTSLHLKIAVYHNNYDLCATCLDSGLKITEDEFYRALEYKSDNILRLMLDRKIEMPEFEQSDYNFDELFYPKMLNSRNKFTDDQKRRTLSCLKMLIDEFHIFDKYSNTYANLLKEANEENLEDCVDYLKAHAPAQ